MSKCKPCIFSQDAGVESLQTSFWDTDQSLLLNGTNTVVKSSEQESQTDGLTECQCGKETLSCSIHPNTKDEWIAFMQDSLAKILAKPVVKEALGKIRDLDYIEKSYAFPIHFNLDTCSWKTWQTSLLETMDQCSEQSLAILPREATIVSGVVYQLPKLVLITSATDGGSWPTPTAHLHKECASPSEYKRNEPTIASRIGGKLNPTWVEWLMGWPLFHTDLKR